MMSVMDQLDTSVAHPARRYNYWLGGKDHFAADRASGDEIARFFPTIRTMAVENRRLLQRAVGYLAAEAGIRQYLDIGTGLPTADNTHEVAQRAAPGSRVLYVDNDPLVLVHARALLTSSPEGRTDYLEADLRNPRSILWHPALRETLDLEQPVALVLLAVLHFLPSRERAAEIVHELMAALPAGSYLLATHATQDYAAPEAVAEYRKMLDAGRSDVWPTTRAEFEAVFAGLTLVGPGIVPAGEWRPEPGAEIPDRAEVGLYAGVGRKS
jgi:O-methyltransferase involved in polyketide biosynthesis